MYVASFAIIVFFVQLLILPQPLLLGNVSDIRLDTNAEILITSPPSLIRIHSSIREVQVGDEIVVVTNVRNNDDVYDWRAVVFIEVRDSSGVTRILDWQTGTVNAKGLMQVGVSWVPQSAGAYELRTFAISGLDNPRILSRVGSSEVTIAGSSGSFPVLVENREFEMPYNFSGYGRIASTAVYPATAEIVVMVQEIREDGMLEIHIPLELLKYLQLVTNGQFIIEEDFVVFVDETPVDSTWRDTDEERIGNIPLMSGSETVAILGAFLI